MHGKRYLIGASVAGCAAVCALAGFTAGGGEAGPQPRDLLALQQLQSDFHASGALGSRELLEEIFAENAVANVAGMTFEGRDAVVDFFSSSPLFGKVVSLAPSYKSEYEIHGNWATYSFECVIVNAGGGDPLTTPLSTIPFGAQNPTVEIFQHSTAQGMMVREDGRWVILTFNGSAGPQ
ncbi:MAG: hypothetical protein ACF8R7_07925 [Phycisphaerales bacterium JB039]